MQVALSLIDGVQIPATEPEETPPPPPPADIEVPPPEEPEVPPAAVHAPPRRVEHDNAPYVWSALGLGGVLVASSIPLYLLDGVATCDGPRQSCRDLYDTRAGASAALSLGGTILIGAIVWAIVGGPTEPTEEPQP